MKTKKMKAYEKGAVGRVYSFMKDGKWKYAKDIRAVASSIAWLEASEGLRRMRELRKHGFFIDKRHEPDTMHYQYRLRKPNSNPPWDQSL